MNLTQRALAVALLCTLSPRVGADAPPADVKHYEDRVHPFFTRHCLECHGAEKPKGDFRVDRLTPDFAAPAARERWLAVEQRLRAGEMPPKSKPRPPETE